MKYKLDNHSKINDRNRKMERNVRVDKREGMGFSVRNEWASLKLIKLIE